jgi:hypothetical protein
MLIDLQPKTYPDTPLTVECQAALQHHRLHKGIYQIAHWNPEIIFEGLQRNDCSMNPRSVLWTLRMQKRGSEFYKDDIVSISPLTLWRCYKRPLRKIQNEWGDGEETLLLGSYGVVDDYQQLLDIYDFDKDPRRLCITMVEIRREDEPERDGWRYHKWGEYYGTQNPQCEYIYDDKHIERVFTFSIYQVA